jgi:DNA-binding response OmpR family regulator
MQSAHQTRGRIRFDAFEVDLQAGELRKRDVKVRLQEQPFQILQMLLEHPGEVVSREEDARQSPSGSAYPHSDSGVAGSPREL